MAFAGNWFGVLADAGDPEHGRDPVGELHVDGVAPVQGAEAEEDGGALLAVDVPLDDRRPDLAGRRRVLVPRRLACVRRDGGYLDRAVGVEPEVQHAESTPMAGICTDTGSERASDGPRDEAPATPACDGAGCGACTWEPTATPTAAVPATMSTTPAIPASRARRPAGWRAAARTRSAARRRPRGTRQYAATAPPPMSRPFLRCSTPLA